VSAVRGESRIVVSGEDGRRALEVALQIVEKTHSYVTHPHTA
jgi:hypothetical protein